MPGKSPKTHDPLNSTIRENKVRTIEREDRWNDS